MVDNPLIVFVHGGQHTKQCWQPTINVINSDAPQCPTLAVNLPGHGDAVGDIATLSISDCVDEVVDQIQHHAPQRVIVVGHSMAGITLPGVAARQGAARTHHMGPALARQGFESGFAT
ncbi:alpha/beta fold hydrolase [Marinobacter sp.]|uniref:alpha/beta fold hydrolase n=1 Tax=Marinobacter sp. TaxID=50741 RepID=UPI003BA9735E